MSRLQRKVQFVLGLEDPPAKIARGFAIGMFVAASPFWGFHSLLALGLAILVRGNTAAAIAAAWTSNPLTAPPLYALCYLLGMKVLGRSGDAIDWSSFSMSSEGFHYLLGHLSDLLIPLITGCTIVGAVIGALSYYLMLRAVKRWRRPPAPVEA
ncbi:MAG: DUF2062 domain-containing protein [Myxococcales bacterium]|nr:DUF2062 domain-containing protein [Myxococcales bacterium]